jgi:hypothetical protein
VAFVDGSFIESRSGHLGLPELQSLAEEYAGRTRIFATHMSDDAFDAIERGDFSVVSADIGSMVSL